MAPVSTPASVPLPSDTAVKDIAQLGREAAGIDIVTIKAPAGMVGVPAEIPVGIIHGAQPEIDSVDNLFERYRTAPADKRGIARALTLDSFIALTNRHKTKDSVVFADTTWTNPSFTAVIDYHEDKSAGAANNLKHRVAYSFPLSDEWKAWTKLNGQPMAQGDFAAFIEDRIADLSSPSDFERSNLERDFGTTIATPSDLIRLSRGLQVNVESRLKRAVNLQTGEAEIAFEESHKDANGQPIKVPGLFILAISPFFMGEKVRIPVRLRYRTSGEKLVWLYQIYRPDQFVTERVREDLATVGAQTSLPTFEGGPEA
ncbi:DUF2303 family protein [Labrys portucalensis]|uniref:DUF2303 family protein n=1 Tax=Labrys neptuniae TaxID=376174 RepID=A0ABV6ZJU9_9HYPH